MGLEKVIAVDMMTAEKGVKPLVYAVQQCLDQYHDLGFILVGNSNISDISHLANSRVEIVNSTEVIMPTDSLRDILRKKDSSTYLTARVVGEGKAGAGVSFGNTKGVAISIKGI